MPDDSEDIEFAALDEDAPEDGGSPDDDEPDPDVKNDTVPLDPEE